jgi:hypothetical protein
MLHSNDKGMFFGTWQGSDNWHDEPVGSLYSITEQVSKF